MTRAINAAINTLAHDQFDLDVVEYILRKDEITEKQRDMFSIRVILLQRNVEFLTRRIINDLTAIPLSQFIDLQNITTP